MLAKPVVHYHETLFFGPSLTLGQVHWTLLRAKRIIMQASSSRALGRNACFSRTSKYLNDFGHEVFGKEIGWWIYREETDHGELRSRTLALCTSLRTLAHDVGEMQAECPPADYPELIDRIRAFMDLHRHDVELLRDYVAWLERKDSRAPGILLSEEIWGSPRLADRFIGISGDEGEPDEDSVDLCVEVALGLRDRMRYAVDRIGSDLSFNQYRAWLGSGQDAETSLPVQEAHSLLIRRTSRRVLQDLELYFEKLRDSAEKILHVIGQFCDEPRPVVRTISLSGKNGSDPARICLVQLDYDGIRIQGPGGSLPENGDPLRRKILSALDQAREEGADIVCLPALCLHKDWMEEIAQASGTMIVAGGSYCEDSCQIFPVIVGQEIVNPPYCSPLPAALRQGAATGGGMRRGAILPIYRTPLVSLSVLEGASYPDLSRHLQSHAATPLDLIVNPCYEEAPGRSPVVSSADCENGNLIVVRVNRSPLDGKYGDSCIYAKELRLSGGDSGTGTWRERDDSDNLLVKARSEQMIIADLVKQVPYSRKCDPAGMRERISGIRSFRFNGTAWIEGR